MYRFSVFSIGGILLFTLASPASRRSGTSLFWGRWITHRYELGHCSALLSLADPNGTAKHRSELVPLSHWNFSCTFRLDPHAAFPDTHARSLNTESISKNVPDRNPFTSDCPF